MPTKSLKIAPRKPRTDARRNRERILEVAKEAFTRSGANASLDDVAKDAAVGAGTLYRHFPTRDALIEEVYRCAKRAGSPKVYWQTHETNATAMKLYDKVADKSGFLVYRKNL